MPGRGGYGRSWTAAEIDTLRSLAAGGMDAQGIAAKLGRSRSGVVAKAVRERISLDPWVYARSRPA
jgi:hypothetical protein